MEFFISALSRLQPVPEEWEALFLVGGALAFTLGLVVGAGWQRSLRRFVVVLMGAIFLALTGQAILNHSYTHTFLPDVTAANPLSSVILPEPFTHCSRLEDYASAIGEQEVLSADEWRQAVYSSDCKGATVGTVIAIAFGFFACAALVGLSFSFLYFELQRLNPSFLKRLLQVFRRQPGD